MLKAMVFLPLLLLARSNPQEHHSHPAPEKLGTVSFSISCAPEVRDEFNRSLALLHSFTYEQADAGFRRVVQRDPHCAIAHWGRAMTHYHQLWDLPPSHADSVAASQEIAEASALNASERERGFIQALSLIFSKEDSVPFNTRASQYRTAMQRLATGDPEDTETQVFYALSLISNASPSDKHHQDQKVAADILEPLFRKYPDHPGIPHYLIHACDNQEMAPRALAAARSYAEIAPSAPHALHMPSHIFTRLGMWNDSIASNLAARDAARAQGDVGEQLHAMDYLVYAYLQNGDDQNALRTVNELKAMKDLHMGEFKVGYAATAMPVRYIVERKQWSEAKAISDPPDTAQPHVTALTVWTRGLGYARSGDPHAADREVETLNLLETRLRALGNRYWFAQVDIMKREVMAWSAQAMHQPVQAAALLSSAADDEDAMEKLPVTPGPIVPAREQLGELLLIQGDSEAASKAFSTATRNAPGRRGALQGVTLSSEERQAS